MSETGFEHFDQDDLARARELFSSDKPGTKAHRTANGKVTSEMCDDLRRRYRTGEHTMSKLANEADLNHEVVRRHIRGMCNCPNKVLSVSPSVRYNGPKFVPDSPTTKITPEMCASLRQSIKGTSVPKITEKLEVDVRTETVGQHIRGDCSCDHDEPPRTRDWVVADD